jgi:hypothetical protein
MHLAQIATQIMDVVRTAERRLCYITFQPQLIQIIRGRKGTNGSVYFRHEFSALEFDPRAKQYIFEALGSCGVNLLEEQDQTQILLCLLYDRPFELTFRLQRCIQIVPLSG